MQARAHTHTHTRPNPLFTLNFDDAAPKAISVRFGNPCILIHAFQRLCCLVQRREQTYFYPSNGTVLVLTCDFLLISDKKHAFNLSGLEGSRRNDTFLKEQGCRHFVEAKTTAH
jgi:hypothetical protein